LTLAGLVAERRFSWDNPRHRRCLLEDELPADADAGLVELQAGFRWAAELQRRQDTSWLARRFAWALTGEDSAA
jgi:hypothetical protein